MKTKLLAILAIATIGIASTATAQTLGKSYIGAGYGEAKLDPKEGANDYADLYRIEFNLPVLQNGDNGVDMGIEATRLDMEGAKQSQFLLSGTYYMTAADTFRPFVKVGAGLMRTTDDDNHPMYTVRIGGEFTAVDKLTIKSSIFYEDAEALDSNWGLGVEANYWIIEQVGLTALYEYRDYDFGEGQFYGGGVRVSF